MGFFEGINSPIKWGVAAGVALLTSIVVMPVAKCELVYENDTQQQQPATRSEDRETLRQVINSSEKAQTTLRVVPAQAPASMVQVQTTLPMQGSLVSNTQAGSEVQNLSKTEMMRRERVREEVKNEDILQERLEELRLRDEKHRTETVLGMAPSDAGTPVQAATSAPLGEQTIVVPITERRPEATAVATVLPAPPTVHADQLTVSSASVVTTTDAVSGDRTQIGIQPRFGFSSMNNVGYDIHPRYTAGIGLDLIVSDNVSFEAGYTYSEFGIALNSMNPYVQWAASYSGAGYNPNFESVALKQNVIDAGIKLHVLGQDSRLRPFIGGGGGYAKSFLNYDQSILSVLNQRGYTGMGTDYQVNSFLGFVSTGLDVRVNKNIMIGATFKYYTVLSANESTQLNNAALGGYPGMYSGVGYTAVTPDKQIVGGTLARASFYSITGSVGFAF